MPDIELTCSTCQTPFLFSEDEQAFFAERGFQTPRRCRRCRQSRKGGGRGGQGSGRRPAATSGRRPAAASGRQGAASARQPVESARRTWATHCAGCGQETRLPWPPAAGQPSFCALCFRVRCAERVGVGEEDEA